MKTDSWDNVASWYDSLVGEKGSDYHKNVVLPGALALLAPGNEESVLDLACGQGVFARLLEKKGCRVTGIDASPGLIDFAKKRGGRSSVRFLTLNAENTDELQEKFDAITILLAVQNMKNIERVLEKISLVSHEKTRMLWVLMHPSFRIPRQSSWGFDESKKTQYRRIDRYMTPLDIPIQMHPGSAPGVQTFSYHRPLSYYTKILSAAGWVITEMEEWCSHRTSEGKRAKAENRAREEFPLFLAILSRRGN